MFAQGLSTLRGWSVEVNSCKVAVLSARCALHQCPQSFNNYLEGMLDEVGTKLASEEKLELQSPLDLIIK